jgi:tetratricopeptide (TPR) repeat protein
VWEEFVRRLLIAACCSLFLVPEVLGAQVVDAKRRDAWQHYQRGKELMYEERFLEAVGEFRQAIRLDPLMTLAHYDLGQSHMALKEYDRAATAFLDCRDAYRQLSGLSRTQAAEVDQRLEEEVRELRDHIRDVQSGRIKSPHTEVMRVTKLEERIRELEGMRQKGVAGGEAIPAEVFLSLGSAYFRQGKLSDAEREWTTASKINPKLGEAWNNLAVAYLLTQRPREAQAAVDQAERAGFRVNPNLKADIKKAIGS